MSLEEMLMSLDTKGKIPMHMPGHKRSGELSGLPYSMDITEIDGFDDLHGMNEGGCIYNIARLAQSAYGIEAGTLSAYPLVGGSTVGILAAVRAAATQMRREGIVPSLLMARNCHKSVWHAAELANLPARYLCPRVDENRIFGEITPDEVKEKLEQNAGCNITVITSPTYEGVISDVKAIGDEVHKRGGILIVDAAHGAHLPFVSNKNNVFDGADAVILSLHKTLPALTQCALLLLPSDRICKSEISRQLGVFETSSPSYLLLSSIEKAITLALGESDRFAAYNARLAKIRAELESLLHLSLYNGNGYGYDSGKLVLTVGADSGAELAQLFRQEGIELEMSAPRYVVAMTSAWDMVRTEGGFASPNLDAFLSAAKRIDSLLKDSAHSSNIDTEYSLPRFEMSVGEALESQAECVSLDDACGRISASYIWAYPPGIPIIAPGEVLDKDVISTLKGYISSKVSLRILPECDGGVWVKK